MRTVRQRAAVDSPQLALALVAREEGVARTTRANAGFVLQARDVAAEICRARGSVTADDLRAECARRELAPGHFNAWGAVFAGSRSPFCWTGEFVRSTAVAGHGNLQRVRRLR